ncbi:MAG: PLP-dependent transferase [Cyclobacteriaceae bacterium]|nr:PLP-dependent transferase [Cyclobacteriaceae bacterium]
MKKEKKENNIRPFQWGYSNRIFRDGRTIENVLSTLQPGDELLMGSQLYNISAGYIQSTCKKLGVKVQETEAKSANSILNSISTKTKMIWLESPSGPTLRIFDLASLSLTARQHNITLVVDNTLGTPLLQNPSTIGVDIILHRHIPALKTMNRQEVGVVLSRDQEIASERPTRMEESQSFFKTSKLWFEKFSTEINIQTENTSYVARFLEETPSVARVYYPGHPGHPNFTIAKQFLKAGGNLLSFYLEDDTPEAAERILKKFQLFRTSTDNNGNRSLMNHPSQTTFGHLPAYMKRRAGIRDSLLWLYVGKEPVDDLLENLEKVL